MVMKSRQINNTLNAQYITDQRRIQYSMATLHPYEDLRNNIDTIIETKFNKSNLKTIDTVSTFITNDILNYNKKEYVQCFDQKGAIFYKKEKEGAELDEDKKAEKLLNDILPLLIKKSKKIYDIESEKYTDLNDPESHKDFSEIVTSYKNIKNIAKIGSSERKKCIKKIADCYCVSNTELKSYFKNDDDKNSFVIESIPSQKDGDLLALESVNEASDISDVDNECDEDENEEESHDVHDNFPSFYPPCVGDERSRKLSPIDLPIYEETD